jgi:hypothetical protein
MVTPSNQRSVYIQVPPLDRYLLAVGDATDRVAVLALGADGSLGAEVPQPAPSAGNSNGGKALDLGTFVHQIRADPTGKYAVICDRGNDPGQLEAGALALRGDRAGQ